MATRETSKMVRHTIQVILVWWYLIPRVVHSQLLSTRYHLVDAGRKCGGHVVRQVQALEREVDQAFDLVCAVALG
jgi:hypothetical protein